MLVQLEEVEVAVRGREHEQQRGGQHQHQNSQKKSLSFSKVVSVVSAQHNAFLQVSDEVAGMDAYLRSLRTQFKEKFQVGSSQEQDPFYQADEYERKKRRLLEKQTQDALSTSNLLSMKAEGKDGNKGGGEGDGEGENGRRVQFSMGQRSGSSSGSGFSFKKGGSSGSKLGSKSGSSSGSGFSFKRGGSSGSSASKPSSGSGFSFKKGGSSSKKAGGFSFKR